MNTEIYCCYDIIYYCRPLQMITDCLNCDSVNRKCYFCKKIHYVRKVKCANCLAYNPNGKSLVEFKRRA